MKGGILAGAGAIVLVILAIWLFFVVLKIAIKLALLGIVVVAAVAAFYAVKKRIGGGDAR